MKWIVSRCYAFLDILCPLSEWVRVIIAMQRSQIVNILLYKSPRDVHKYDLLFVKLLFLRLTL
jgi:hypothetical protein